MIGLVYSTSNDQFGESSPGVKICSKRCTIDIAAENQMIHLAEIAEVRLIIE
jgi:hypothetical protein